MTCLSVINYTDPDLTVVKFFNSRETNMKFSLLSEQKGDHTGYCIHSYDMYLPTEPRGRDNEVRTYFVLSRA